MPEVKPQRLEALKLSPVEIMRRRIEGEQELIDHRGCRLREAQQRKRDYETELRKLGG